MDGTCPPGAPPTRWARRKNPMNFDGSIVADIAADLSMQEHLGMTYRQFLFLRCHAIKVVDKYNEENDQRLDRLDVQFFPFYRTPIEPFVEIPGFPESPPQNPDQIRLQDFGSDKLKMNLEPRIPLRQILQPVLNPIGPRGAQPADAPQDPDELQRLTEMRRNKYIEFIGILNRHQILRHERIRQLRQRIPEQQNRIQAWEDYIVQKNVLEYHIVPLMGNLYIGQPIDQENQREILNLLNEIDDLREPVMPELNVDPDEQEVIEDLDPMEENKPIGLEILERRILKDFQLRRHGERRREERIQQLEEEQRRSIRRLGILFGEEIRRREEIVRLEERERRHREQIPQLEAEIVPGHPMAPQNEQLQEPAERLQAENDRRIRGERRNQDPQQRLEIPRNERVEEEEVRIRDLQRRLEIYRNPRRPEPARLNHPYMVEGDPVKPEFQSWDFQYWSKQHFREWVELVLPENLRQDGIIDRIRVMNLDGAVIPELATDDSMQRLLELTPHQFHLLKCHSMKVINKYNDERRQRFGGDVVQ